MKNSIKQIALVAFIMISANISAQTLDGNWGYETNPRNGQISLFGKKISNNNFSGCSGTLKLELWATQNPYSGGWINGYVLGSATLGQLQAGYSFNGVNHTVRYCPPPNGWYNMVMVLREYNNGSYKIISWVNMSGRQCFQR